MDGFTKLQAQTGQATAATISYLECRRGHLWLGCVRLALILPLPPAMSPSFHCRAAPPIFSMGPAATVFLTCMISYLLFLNLTHKTETGTAKDEDTTNSKPPGPIKPSSQSTAGVRLCCAFLPASASCAKVLGQNHFAEPNQHVLTFLHPKFAVQCTELELLLVCGMIAVSLLSRICQNVSILKDGGLGS
jgi:hypothetical protein